MRFDLPAVYLTLTSSTPLTISKGVGAEIRVLAGRVWLTEENFADDIFLFAGASYALRHSGRAVISAEGPADTAVRIVVAVPVSVRSRSVAATLCVALREWVRRAVPAHFHAGFGTEFRRTSDDRPK